MARPCSICTGPPDRRTQIDAAILARRESFAAISRRSAVSKDSVLSHRTHVSATLTKAADTREARAAVKVFGRVVGRLEALEERAERLLSQAEKKGQLSPAAALLRELHSIIRTLAEISGELKGGAGGLTINVLGNPQFLAVQQKIVTALEPFPEARAAVLAALVEADAPDA